MNVDQDGEGHMDNIVLREDFLVKKILLSKSEIGQEKDYNLRMVLEQQ